jgi:5-methyltetrahydropteroyltriglutamate--homocysteine methyltransferase
LPTTVVGSYPQPDWLIDRDMLKTQVPRVRVPEIWRLDEKWLKAAQDDAALLAIRDMERAGIDIITDGECRRESYSNRFATALEGVDIDTPAIVRGRTGNEVRVPRITGPIRRRRAVEIRAVEFLRSNTDRMTKITMPGPFTMSKQAKDEHYNDEEAVAMDFAVAVNEELHDLKKAGVDVVQLDEPWMQAHPEAARRFAVKAIDRALEEISGPRVVHLCFGYSHFVTDKAAGRYAFLEELADCAADQISIETAQPNLQLDALDRMGDKTIILGVLDLGTNEIETAETVAARIRAALAHLPAERIIPAPDCGMKYFPREVAFGKLCALAEGAAIIRSELAG